MTGLHFQCLFLGETGIGKSTLSDSLFNTTFDSAPENHKEPGVRLKAHTYELQESRVAMKNLRRVSERAAFVHTFGLNERPIFMPLWS